MKSKLNRKYDFVVIMKEKTTEKEYTKLMEEIFKNKFVKSIEETIVLGDKKKGGKKDDRRNIK